MNEASDMDTTIYHNPACGTSRNSLAMFRNAEIEPAIVDYLSSPHALKAMIGIRIE